MRSNRESHLRDESAREGRSRTAPRRNEGELAEGVPLHPLRRVPRVKRSAGERGEGEVREGGGVYVYRTRKPASLLGLLHSKIGTPWYAFFIGAGIAALILHLTGSPWWIGLAVLLTSGRHFAYVGETVTFKDRHLEHTRGGGRWKKPPAAWSDLDPVCVLRISLPKKKNILHAVEWLFVKLCAPVYNEKLNKANPRRITRDSAKRMRRRRDKRRVTLSLWNIRFGHVIILFVAFIVWSVN